MPAIQEISDTLIRDQIVKAVVEVFKTMLSEAIGLSTNPENQQLWPPYTVPHAPQAHVVGTVGFLGDINGLIYIYLPVAFAEHCTGKLLGMTAEELTEAGAEPVNDAVGELTNMIVGVFKNGLCDVGYACKLTIPSIMRGDNFSVDVKRPNSRHIYVFESHGHRVVADILMKTDE
ncbi:MAG TPA: chemotaxis protein CheX [Opitutaceae bacterium]|jgi:chemotaxis protein CheX